MAFKEWFRRLRPMQLYIMLVLTGVFFTVELVISHFTHSLTLLVDSYHMLCNMIALVGCVITIKKLHLEESDKQLKVEESKESKTNLNCLGQVMNSNEITKSTHSIRLHEKSLKNTFGWARIDILVMLIGCVFLASLCFSLLVEALQTLIHIDHHDEMHFPLIVLVVAGFGLLLNGVCYLLIGGYTFHQGSYLHVTADGDVVLERAVTAESLRRGERRLSSQVRRKEPVQQAPPIRQGAKEMIRDVIGCIFVVICALLVYFTTGLNFAKYLDPILSIVSASCLLVLSYPYMKESGLILLQTIPNHINIDSLRAELLKAFPDIVNVHDLHVWQLNANKIFSTAHIIFLKPSDYVRINKDVTEFFRDQGITQVTIQAEFLPKKDLQEQKKYYIKCVSHLHGSNSCLMECLTEECRKRHCCTTIDDCGDLEKVQVDQTPKNEQVIPQPGTPKTEKAVS